MNQTGIHHQRKDQRWQEVLTGRVADRNREMNQRQRKGLKGSLEREGHGQGLQNLRKERDHILPGSQGIHVQDQDHPENRDIQEGQNQDLDPLHTLDPNHQEEGLNLQSQNHQGFLGEGQGLGLLFITGRTEA